MLFLSGTKVMTRPIRCRGTGGHERRQRRRRKRSALAGERSLLAYRDHSSRRVGCARTTPAKLCIATQQSPSLRRTRSRKAAGCAGTVTWGLSAAAAQEPSDVPEPHFAASRAGANDTPWGLA